MGAGQPAVIGHVYIVNASTAERTGLVVLHTEWLSGWLVALANNYHMSPMDNDFYWVFKTQHTHKGNGGAFGKCSDHVGGIKCLLRQDFCW